MRKPEHILPIVVFGTAVAVATGCSSGYPEAPSAPNVHYEVANPNYVPRLQALGKTFLMLYNHSPSEDRSTPFEANGQITVAEVDVHVGPQVLKLTINQLPSAHINPSGITSLDVLRFSQPQPLAGFDMNFGRNIDGTLDASCSAYQKPQGFSESHQTTIYDHASTPLPGSSPQLADGFLSDMLTSADQLLALASLDVLSPTSPRYSTGDPCGTNFGY